MSEDRIDPALARGNRFEAAAYRAEHFLWNVADGVGRYASFLPDPQRLQVVPGTDHFWQGFEPVLVDAARQFFAEALVAPPHPNSPPPGGKEIQAEALP